MLLDLGLPRVGIRGSIGYNRWSKMCRWERGTYGVGFILSVIVDVCRLRVGRWVDVSWIWHCCMRESNQYYIGKKALDILTGCVL
jgi:hypothetical protein